MTSGTLRRYVPFATSSLQASMQYRADLLVSLLTTSVSTAVVVFLWRAVIGQHPDGALGGFSVAGITTYLLAAQLLTLMHNSKAGEDTSQEIVGGDIAVSLVRPVSYPVSRVFMALPTALTNLVLVGLPLVAIFALLFPMSAPSPLGLALFVLAAVPSVVIAFSVQLLVGMSALITTNTWGWAWWSTASSSSSRARSSRWTCCRGRSRRSPPSCPSRAWCTGRSSCSWSVTTGSGRRRRSCCGKECGPW